MSRLCGLGGDLGSSIAFASRGVRAAPEDPAARAALNIAMSQRPNPALGLQRYHEAVALEPRITDYIECYGSALPFEEHARLRALLEEALMLDPALAPAYAALANVLARQEQVLLAIPAYRRAIEIDPEQPEALLALSELLEDIGDTEASAQYRGQALSRKRLYSPRPTAAGRRSVLVLNAPASWPHNTPLEFMVDRDRAALHRLYLTGDPAKEDLPAYDVVFTAIGESEEAHDAIAIAQAFITSQDKRVINQPANLWKTARPNVAAVLEDVYGCTAPRTERLGREELASRSGFPLLVRPIDTHAGRGLERVHNEAAVTNYLQRHEDDRFDAVPFIDYRSADGYYRKYRVIMVEGTPYPYHLAISPDWMVHYIKTPTASIDWMRGEEERFLTDPRSVFANWERTFAEMAGAFGLDYVGVDCALMPDGEVLVFEADTALLVHCREPEDSYKYRYVPAIFRAVEALLLKR